MAYAPMPKMVSIHSPIIGCDRSMSMLTEVLQSESVQRLLNRQNVFLQNSATIGSMGSSFASSRRSLNDRNNGVTIEIQTEKEAELSVIPIMSVAENGTSPSDSEEDEHLLPSKHEGKSAIALLPIRREKRACGHYEPCESIVCEVMFQQLKDGDAVHPLIAVNIDVGEIDAPVSKHCKSDRCDALNVDHDRCRRAIIRCHRCDKINTCDICLVVLKTRKSQMNHKNCKMRIEYRHNRASRGQILRDRMRQRELQIIEAARINKNDYTDPVNGHDRAMESLQNNSELIVIPKAALPVQQHPTIRITSVTGAAITPNTQIGDLYGKVLPRLPLVFPPQGVLLGKRMSAEPPDNLTPAKQTQIGESAGAASSSSGSVPQCNPFITITAIPTKNFMQPVTVNNFLQSQSQTSPASQMQSNPFLMPIRMVPIASLKTEPSLMHHTQGIPKFCLVADSPTQPPSAYIKSPKRILPALPSRDSDKTESNINSDPKKSDTRAESILKKFKTGIRRSRRKKLGSKRGSKAYECTFCFKKFSTDWYFKLHIAKHKGEIKFTCKFCKKPFMHLYNMTKHMVTMHKTDSTGESVTVEETDENIEEDKQSLNCANCNQSFESKTELENHPCRIVCLLCHVRVLHGDLLLHLKARHIMSNEKAVEEYERQKQQRAIVGKSRVRIKRGLVDERVRRSRVNEETGEVDRQRNLSTRKRNTKPSNEARKRSVGSNDQGLVRRLTRRRNNSLIDQLETTLPNKIERVYLSDRIQRYEESVPMSPSSPNEDPLDTHTSR